MLAGLMAAQPLLSNSTVADTRSTELLNKVSKTYKAYKTIKASFTIAMKSAKATKAVKQKGKLYLKGKMFRIEMAGQEIYCDGTTMWTYLKDANEVQITDYDPDALGISPSNIFTIHENGFKHRYISDVTEGKKTMHLIEMTPTDKKKPYFKVKTYINKVGSKIEKMEVSSKNGSKSTYSIDKFASNVKMSSSFFKFDAKKKPGVVEIDLR